MGVSAGHGDHRWKRGVSVGQGHRPDVAALLAHPALHGADRRQRAVLPLRPVPRADALAAELHRGLRRDAGCCLARLPHAAYPSNGAAVPLAVPPCRTAALAQTCLEIFRQRLDERAAAIECFTVPPWNVSWFRTCN